MINFDDIKEVSVPHLKGGEGHAECRAVDDGKVRIMRSVLQPGCSIGLHCHEDSSEIIYILEGEATCYLDGKKEIVRAGQVHYCPKGSTHTMKNETDRPVVCFNVIPKQ
jgi:quercetin dioxygenase-like cupin family protein